MSDEIKYCEDCRFFDAADGSKQFGRCRHAKATPCSPEIFIAREFNAPPYAQTMRGSDKCGPEAKLFEPKDADQ